MTTPATTSVPFTLELPGEPGRVLRGVVDAPADAAAPLAPVLVLHGFKGFFRWGFFPLLAERLAAAGFAAVRFNFSGSGVGADLESFTEDAAFEANTPSREREDAAYVLRALLLERAVALPFELRPRVGLVGHSMGGAVALLLAGGASPVPVDAVVTWASVASFDRFDEAAKATLRGQGWLPIPNARTGQVHRVGRGWLEDVERPAGGVDPLEAAAAVRAPTLLLHGLEDASVRTAEAERLADALPTGVGRLETLSGAGHTFGARHPQTGAVPESLEDVLGRTLAHLRAYLDAPAR